MRLRGTLWLLIASTVLFAAVEAARAVEAAPKTFVSDRAGVIDSATEKKLLGLLSELEQKTSARIVVVTVKTTGGQDIHQYAFERADAWTFGSNRKSASALVVVAVKDRKYRIEVGYNLEPVLTDGFVGQVGRDYFVPNFRAGQYGQGIFQATAAMAVKVAESKGVKLTGMPTMPKRPRGHRRRFSPIAFFVLMLLIIGSSIFGRGRRHRGGILPWIILASGGRRGGFGGGGFGGGGFGGFGGGGGGGFGGGGASGGW